MRVYLVKPVCKSHEQRKKSGNSNEPIFICAKIFIYSFLNSLNESSKIRDVKISLNPVSQSGSSWV